MLSMRKKRCRALPEDYELESESMYNPNNDYLQLVSDFEVKAIFFSNFLKHALGNQHQVDANTLRKTDSVLYEMKRFVDSIEKV